MQTDSSLDVLDNITTAFGQRMRHFAEVTCRDFNTFETDKEYGARQRAAARRKERGEGGAASAGGRRSKGYNLMTSKLHALGDYVAQIRLFGTTDSFTSQIVSCSILFRVKSLANDFQGELQHRIVKAWNERSSKNNAVPQIVKMDARERVHREMDEALATTPNSDPTIHGPMDGNPPDQDLDVKYRIAHDSSAASRVYISTMLDDHKNDPAFKVCDISFKSV